VIKILNRLVIIVCVLFVAACDSPKLTSLNKGDTILAFGDSLTYGVGTAKEYSYPSILSDISGMEVINSGVSGETTDEGLKRLPRELEKFNPKLVILLEGGNDILRNRDESFIKRDLGEMVETAKGYGAEVVLIGVPKKSLFSSSAPLYSELAEKYDLAFDGDLIGGLMRTPSKKSDSIHFNKSGYRDMAESIYQLLLENGAIK